MELVLIGLILGLLSICGSFVGGYFGARLAWKHILFHEEAK
jgi:MFS-type transporter involved in bile tolerance (Atg22 family)